MRFRITTYPADELTGQVKAKLGIADPEAADSAAFRKSGCAFMCVDGTTVARTAALAVLRLKVVALEEVAEFLEECQQAIEEDDETPVKVTSVEFEEVAA